MNFTDQDLLIATQIAYYTFDQQILEQFQYNARLHKILETDIEIKERILEKIQKAKEGESQLVYHRALSSLNLYNIISSPNSAYGNWIIRDVQDDNDKSGLYACLIETTPNDAIIAYRGSESTNLKQIKKDWIDADLGLLNSTMTLQQKAAGEYMSQVNKVFTYPHYTVTGHSLGGNLTTHATIFAPNDMKQKIVKSVSFDGPGFSDEYLRNSAESASLVLPVMFHYQWSFIGNLLFQIPGIHMETVLTDPMVRGKYDLQSLSQKHDTCFVVFNDDGMVISDSMDNFARLVGNLSRAIEGCPSPVGNMLIGNLTEVSLNPEIDIAEYAGDMLKSCHAISEQLPPKTAKALMAATFVSVIGFIHPQFYQQKLIPFINGTLSIGIHLESLINYIQSEFWNKLIHSSKNKEVESKSITNLLYTI